MPHVVIHVVAHGLTVIHAHASGVRGDSEPEFFALFPERIVVMGRIETEAVEPSDAPRLLWRFFQYSWYGSSNIRGDQRHLQPKRLSVLKLANALFRRVQGHNRCRRHAILVLVITGGDVFVVRMTRQLAKLMIRHSAVEQTGSRIQHHEIEPKVIHTLVIELGQHGGASVQRVFRG